MRRSAQAILDRVATFRKPGAAELTLVAIALAVLVLPQWWALEHSRAVRNREVRATLELALDSGSATLDAWGVRLLEDLQSAVERDGLIPVATQALDNDESARERLRALVAGLSLSTPGVEIVDHAVAEAQVVEPKAVLAPWPRPSAGDRNDGGWSLAAHFPLDPQARRGRLTLRLEARDAVSEAIAAIRRPESFGLYAWAPETGWLTTSAEPPCAPPPSGPGSSQRTQESCPDGALASWRSVPDLGLRLLSEVRVQQAFRPYSTARISVGVFAALMAVLLFLGVWRHTRPSEPSDVEIHGSTRNTAAWGILAVSLLATGFGWLSSKIRFDEYRTARFESDAQELADRVQDRLRQHARDLGSAGALISPKRPSPATWERFVASLNLAQEYPALDCLVLLPFDGSAPESERRLSAGREPCANEAAERFLPGYAESAGLEGPVEALVWGAEADSPLDETRLALVLRSARSKQTLLAVLSADALLEDLSDRESELDFELRVKDSIQAEAATFFASHIDGPLDDPARHRTAIEFDFAGAEWRLLASRARLAPAIAENYPAQMLLAGLAISVLLFDIALVLSSTRSRAQGIAQLMTKRFRDSEERIRAVIDHAPDGIVTFASNGEIQTFNPSAARLFGYSLEQASRMPIDRLLPICRPGEAGRMEEFASEGGRACVGVRSDGSEFPAELTVSSMRLDDQTLYAAIVRDVSIRRQTEEKLRESEERYALAARGANDGLWDWNLRNDEVYYSERWKEIIGFEDGAIGARPDEWFERVHPEDLPGLRATLNEHLEGRTEFFESEYRIRHANGGYRWVLSRGVAVRDAYGKATRLAGSQTDTTKRKRVEKQLLYDALHDPLTGLPNRTYFMAQLESARKAVRGAEGPSFGLLFLDVDRFKVVNDSLGHFVGDQLLVSIAERLKACVRPGDTICRLGGDEFAVLIENLTDVRDATQVADRIQKNLERPLEAGAQDVYAAVSIGIALSSAGRESPEDLLRDADIAMYRAKALGRRRYELFDQHMHTHAVELLQIETDLRRAVERGEMQIVYQPIYSLAENRVTGCEALIRWRHPTRGLLSPHQFISVAEETGVINDIGAWLLEQTCKQNAEWRKAGVPASRISVNVSPRQLLGQDLRQLVLDALQTYDLEPDSLQLELTESALMESSDASIRPLEELYRHGVQISLDDFGTGYSSLIYLRRFPIHNIKIDQSFVSRIPGDEGDSAIVSGLITLAHTLKLSVIAEGVETVEQVEFLREQGCDAIQGFVLSRPVSAAQIPEILRDGLPAAVANGVLRS